MARSSHTNGVREEKRSSDLRFHWIVSAFLLEEHDDSGDAYHKQRYGCIDTLLPFAMTNELQFFRQPRTHLL